MTKGGDAPGARLVTTCHAPRAVRREVRAALKRHAEDFDTFIFGGEEHLTRPAEQLSWRVVSGV